jgi:methionine synthase II (cobalamin-independent)
MTAAIQTTVIGSYPVPEWLRALPNQVNLRDAVMVVMKSHELAGIDVISDGELSRFDVSHPDTNGMIEYFVRPMSGIDSVLSRQEREAFRNRLGLPFRTQARGQRWCNCGRCQRSFSMFVSRTTRPNWAYCSRTYAANSPSHTPGRKQASSNELAPGSGRNAAANPQAS